MRRIVIIDGENLTYGLRHLMSTSGKKAQRTIIEGFDYRGLVNELFADNLPSEVLWFGARLKVYDQSEDIKRKSESAIKSQSKFVNDLQRQKIQFIKVGYLRARESEACEKCTHQTWRLAEKGVDVGIAVRIITEATKNDTEIVVISADTDLLPAFNVAKKMGAKIMHIGYEYRFVHALAKSADTHRTITLPMVQKYLANH